MEAHSTNILRKSGRGASREGGYVRAGAGQVEGWVPVRPARMASRVVGRSEFSGNGLRWSVGRRPRKRMCGISGGGGCRVADRGLGPVCSWSRQGVGMSGVGRCAADRRCRVVGQQGGCRAGAGRCGPLGAARAGVDRWERRGSAWTLCSGGAGMEPPPFPDGPVASPGHRAPSSRAAPSGRGPMLRFRTLFVLFCSVPPRRNRRRLQIRGFAAREKRKSCFFIFTL